MALLGSGIDPRLFISDSSGIANIGAIQGQMYSDIGSNIGKAATAYGDFKKGQADDKKTVDSIAKMATMFEKAAPGMIPGIGELAATLEDQNIPLSERVASAQALTQMFTLGPALVAQQQDALIKQQQLALAQQAAAMNAATTPTSTLFGGVNPGALTYSPLSTPAATPAAAPRVSSAFITKR